MISREEAEQELEDAKRALRKAESRVKLAETLEAAPIKESDVKIEQKRDGVRFYVQHKDSDSLAIIDVEWAYDQIRVKSGLRGNVGLRFNRQRPLRWTSSYMDAPKLSPAQLKRNEEIIEDARRRLHGE